MLNIDALIRSLFALDEGLRLRSAAYLLDVGEPAIDPLLLAIENDDCSEEAIGYENRFIRQVFVQLGEPAFQRIVRDFEAGGGRRATVKLMVMFGDPRAVPILMQHIEKNPASPSATYAIEALAVFRDPRSFDLLRSLLTHPNELTRNCAALAIAEFHDPSTVEPLQAVLAAVHPIAGFNYWQRAIEDAIRYITDPTFRPSSRGFFINHKYAPNDGSTQP